MIGNSNERLFGGINKIIAEKYAKMKEGTSVSDTDQKALGDKEQLDEVGCRKKMEESQDYKVFMKKDDWDSKVGNLHLNPAQNGKDHVEAKDEQGNVQGWWNGHTGVGYLHKDCCDHALSETNQLGNVEEGTQVSEEMQNEKPQEDTLNNFVSSNTPMAEDAVIPDVKIPDGKLDINHSTISEDSIPQFDIGYKRTHLPSGRVYFGKFNPSHHWMFEAPNKYHPDNISRIADEKVNEWVRQQPNTWKYEIQPEISKHLNLNESLEESTLSAPDEMCLDHDKKIEEAHMTPELQKKQEDYVMKLKKNEDSFKDKYGDNWEGVMYATATKLAKNDLGIKEETIEESQNDPLQKDSVGDAIVTDQPIKN